MRNTRYPLLLAAALVLLAVSLPAQAQTAGESVRRMGRKFKDAITDTYYDAVAAIKGESASPRRGTGTAYAAVYYVSMAEGSNRGDGTREAPFKNIQKALDVAPEGALILVAEGNYFGTLRSGNITIERPVTIQGGYNSLFSERDILRYRTTVRPDAASNETQSGKGTLQVKVRRPGTNVTVDGLLFDRGFSIAYAAEDEGWPEGVASGRMQPPGTPGVGGEKLDGECKTAQTAVIFLDNCQSEVVIRNCAFVNAPDCAIRGSAGSVVTIENCVFAAVRKAAVEITGANLARNADIRFTRNTVLFAWPSDPEEGELGFAFRFMNGANGYLDHNILGCCSQAALDRCRIETIREKETQKVTSAEYNIFFCNPLGDIALPGGDRPILVRAADFDDVEQLTGVTGNRDWDDASLFDGAVDPAYLDGFLHGGTMFMNRYPFERALDLFGAVEDYGAQAVHYEQVEQTTRRDRKRQNQ